MSQPQGFLLVYAPLIILGIYIGIFPYDFQLPVTDWDDDGLAQKQCVAQLIRILSAPLRFLIPVVYSVFFVLLVVVVTFQLSGLRVVNDTLKAVTWNISGANSAAIFALFRRHSSQIMDIVHELHRVEQSVIRGEKLPTHVALLSSAVVFTSFESFYTVK